MARLIVALSRPFSTSLEQRIMEFLINDMTCSHCVGRITKAVVAADAAADVRIDLATKTARIATGADADAIAAAIAAAGYTPVLQRG
jgi:copper chaperone CopZ